MVARLSYLPLGTSEYQWQNWIDLSQLPDSVSSWMMSNFLEEEHCVALDFSGNSLVLQRL